MSDMKILPCMHSDKLKTMHTLFIIPCEKFSDVSLFAQTYPYLLSICKKTRYGRDCIPYCISRKFYCSYSCCAFVCLCVCVC